VHLDAEIDVRPTAARTAATLSTAARMAAALSVMSAAPKGSHLSAVKPSATTCLAARAKSSGVVHPQYHAFAYARRRSRRRPPKRA